jgi:hypothetical protein
MIQTIERQESCPCYRDAKVILEGSVIGSDGCRYHDDGICRCDDMIGKINGILCIATKTEPTWIS